MKKLISLIAGIIFGIGLVISEMINPAKVLGFLDLFGNWDPSLAFVMIGALIISSPLFHLIKNKDKPLLVENEYIDMPDYFKLIKDRGFSVGVCPIHEYWIDVGKPESLTKADKEWKKTI